MRVAVEASCWGLHRGYGRHLRGVLGAFVERYTQHNVVFVSDTAPGEYAVPAGATWVDVPTGRSTLEAAAADGGRSAADMWRVSRALAGVAADVVLFPTVYSFVPTMARRPVAVFIHDAIAETYPDSVFGNAAAARRWRMKVWLAKRNASQIITVSGYASSALQRALALDSESIAVVGEAPDPVFRRLESPILPLSLSKQGVDASRRLLVYVGGFGPHKNLVGLLEAFSGLGQSERFADLQLVFVGDPSKDAFLDEWEAIRAHSEPLGDKIVFAGFVPDADMVELLNVAELLVLPSLMEGYGLPAVEAAACGCAVAATENSAVPELFGDAAKTFPPEDTTAMQAAMVEALEESAALGQAGWERVQRLSWPGAAEQLEAVLRRMRGET